MNKRLWFLAPLLVIYVLLILLLENPPKGDELRYINYASNIINGSYTDVNDPDLSNGPAYPLLLAPFVAFHIDFIAAKFLNGIFVLAGVIFFYRTLCYYTKTKYAMLIAVALGLYPPMLWWMTRLYSDAFAFMLINGVVFYFCSAFQTKKKNWKTCVLASLSLGILVLTKVIFLQVVLVSFLVLGIYLLVRKRYRYRFPLYILLGAFLVITPYIIYTYSVTHKFLYLSTRGGEILYHRTTPFEGEYGNWISETEILEPEQTTTSTIIAYDFAKLKANHRDFYLQLEPLSNMERDSAFKARAIDNIKNYPLKFLQNTVTNIGRLLFNYPNSYKAQSLNALGYVVVNGFLFILVLLSAYPMMTAWKGVPVEIRMTLFFAFAYCGGMVLLHGKPRYFIMIVPSLLLGITYVSSNVLKIKFLRPKNQV
ncbi:ArnT family glycosyltransferase [Zobellia barbeyronii]|uniref:Glycosyltransferase family 39 protein n=1 Tax=Zobellia barbeyronii TaxID=2748009 RepID=A0ABS5WDQ1_9FLAO|nr:glycosyltransferase family 39 protein [Zobellia barbeyronii]MBT2160267.1 glycosyltransferase family 39 protein [Zobellia barbeyronii]